MEYFERSENALIWRNNGETLEIRPWGPDSFRVRSVMMGELRDDRFALLEPAPGEAPAIQIGNDTASIQNGRLTAEAEMDGWHRYARITFRRADGKVLFRETSPANALALKSRKFEPKLGGDFALTVTFEGQEGERIFGMGQYQEEILDWKGCTLELAHRNSQASVPFLISSRGYGFLWHNPAIGQVTFGKNRTSWRAESTKRWTTG